MWSTQIAQNSSSDRYGHAPSASAAGSGANQSHPPGFLPQAFSSQGHFQPPPPSGGYPPPGFPARAGAQAAPAAEEQHGQRELQQKGFALLSLLRHGDPTNAPVKQQQQPPQQFTPLQQAYQEQMQPISPQSGFHAVPDTNAGQTHNAMQQNQAQQYASYDATLSSLTSMSLSSSNPASSQQQFRNPALFLPDDLGLDAIPEPTPPNAVTPVPEELDQDGTPIVPPGFERKHEQSHQQQHQQQQQQAEALPPSVPQLPGASLSPLGNSIWTGASAASPWGDALGGSSGSIWSANANAAGWSNFTQQSGAQGTPQTSAYHHLGSSNSSQNAAAVPAGQLHSPQLHSPQLHSPQLQSPAAAVPQQYSQHVYSAFPLANSEQPPPPPPPPPTHPPTHPTAQQAQHGGYQQHVPLQQYAQSPAPGQYIQLAAEGHQPPNTAGSQYIQNAPAGQYNQDPAAGQYSQGAAAGQYNQGAAAGQYNQGAAAGQYNQGATAGQYNQGAAAGQYNQGATVGQYNQGAAAGQYNQGAAAGQYNQQGAAAGQYTASHADAQYSQGTAGGQYMHNAAGQYGQQRQAPGAGLQPPPPPPPPGPQPSNAGAEGQPHAVQQDPHTGYGLAAPGNHRPGQAANGWGVTPPPPPPATPPRRLSSAPWHQQLESVNTQLLTLLQRLLPEPQEQYRQQQALDAVRAILLREWPHARVHLFGSAANGLSIGDNNDLDVCLEFPEHSEECQNKGATVERVGEIMTAAGMGDVLSLPRARVPVCKLKVASHNVRADITINNMLATVNTQLLKAYSSLDPRVRHLVLLVKFWAKQRDVNDSYRGTLSSYAYVLMCVFLLQTRKPALLPCLQREPCTFQARVGQWDCSFCDEVDKLKPLCQHNKESLAELMHAFFEYWDRQHDYQNAVISVRLGRVMSKAEKDWTRRIGNERHLLCIEDPFELSHDLGRTIDRFSIDGLKREFARAASLWRREQDPVAKLFEYRMSERRLQQAAAEKQQG